MDRRRSYELYVAFVDAVGAEARRDPPWFARMQDAAWRLGVHQDHPDWA